jgi:lipopolysaccharide transport system ATP-binding protein
MAPLIEAKNLGKKYDIAHMRGGYVALRDVVARAFKDPLRFLGDKARSAVGLSKREEFWALRNVSFSIERGEVVGVIGANGAGKSTLLKILSQITPPTEGEVVLRGRVGSLLEVGTGFHPELSGRENIFLNGAILGMKRTEIARKFDEIVAFAGVEKFLDTPVKHYSSGMYVRLAFSVAAHMEPDILLVDEVLAVGDAEFQKKCLGKMDEITRKNGRTIFFVSHNMAAIESLCPKSIILSKGQVAFFGPTGEAIRYYLKDLEGSLASEDLATKKRKKGRLDVKVEKISLSDGSGNKVTGASTGAPLSIDISYSSKFTEPLKNCRVAVSFRNRSGHDLFICSTETAIKGAVDLKPQGTISCLIPQFPLGPGKYILSLMFEVNKQLEDSIEDAAVIETAGGDFFGTGVISPKNWEERGVLVKHSWIS